MRLRARPGIILALLLAVSIVRAEINYPWKDVYIGALDAAQWAGMVLVPNRDTAYAFRVQVSKGESTAEGIDFLYLISEVGPHSPDGRYARIRFDVSLPFDQGNDTPILKKPSSKSDSMTLEWSRQDERTVIGRLIAPKGFGIRIISYFPWDIQGRYLLRPDGQIQGEGLSRESLRYLLWTSPAGTEEGEGQGAQVVLSYQRDSTKEIYFVAGIGEDVQLVSNRIYRYKNEKTIESFLEEEARIYDKNRVSVEGRHQGTAASITNNLFWNSLFQKGFQRYYTPAARDQMITIQSGRPAFWTTFTQDAFFNAALLAVESSKHATDMIKAVLETQYPNGNIPQWRAESEGSPDRSHPPIGSYFVLKLFQKTGNLDLLRFAYPYLARWHEFWTDKRSNGLIRRDGNADGLLEWGSDPELVASSDPEWMDTSSGKSRARLESGMPDLPNWDVAGFDPLAGTLSMNCLDLNTFQALDAWCLSQIAGLLDLAAESRIYLEQYEAFKTLINDTFWDSRRGFYYDRHWDGRMSSKMSASSFFPLLARIPDEAQIRQMRRHLLNTTEFWGDFIIPSVSRDSEEYKQQSGWRGSVGPPANYLIYQGLKANGLDAEAHQLADKSAELFLLSWRNFQLSPQSYNARTGESTGRRYQSWGPLMALMALEEYIDITPWEGFRFGMVQPDKGGEVKRVAIQGRHYDAKVTKKEVRLVEEGREIIRAKGPAVFRRFLYNEQEVSFVIMTLKECKVRVRFLVRGKYQFFLDDRLTKIFEGYSEEIKVPAGRHRVDILLIQKQD
jgi:hypothetical protein